MTELQNAANITWSIVQHGYFLWQRQQGIAVDKIKQFADRVVGQNQRTLMAAWREWKKTDLNTFRGTR